MLVVQQQALVAQRQALQVLAKPLWHFQLPVMLPVVVALPALASTVLSAIPQTVAQQPVLVAQGADMEPADLNSRAVQT